MRKYIYLLMLLCLHVATRGQTIATLDQLGLPHPVEAEGLRYWFDDDATSVKSVEIANGSTSIDASSLANGFHTIHYQVVGADGNVYSISTRFFMKMDTAADGSVTPSRLLYWYDDETTVRQTDFGSGTQILDASHLAEGLHTLYFQVACTDGMITPVTSALFICSSDAGLYGVSRVRYWFDEDNSSLKEADIVGGKQLIDATKLQPGLHTICHQLVYSNGEVGVPVTRIFWKEHEVATADGVNRVTKYQYWTNDKTANMKTVELTNAANPYKLISLLPVPKDPIRSSNFHFEITDGQPTIYAKNNFHIRFHDAKETFKDAETTFVDYSVKQTITDVTLLESEVRATSAKPTENAIKWYRLDAEAGDSLQFHLDRAATIQLFAPSNEEVYSASGAEAVAWNGCHVRESGTYYLALHDVKAQQGNDISLDYIHIDKYAVLRQDVCVVGNGGCSTITFEGNGFKDLYAVELIDGSGNTIEHVYIGHESDATTSIVFDFTDAELGTYDAKFRFAEEDKVFNGLVTIEEAKDIELATTVTYSSKYLIAKGVTSYNFTINNCGNMTSYRTPIYIYVASNKPNGINKIKVTGLNLPKLFDGVDRDDLTEEDRIWMSDIEETVGDTHYFIRNAKWDDSINDSIYVWSAYFFTDIAPQGEIRLTVDVSTVDSVNVWVMTPKENVPLCAHLASQLARTKNRMKKSVVESLCCMREKVECVASIIADVTSIASKISDLAPGTPVNTALGVASCVADALNQVVSATGEIMCGQNDVEDKLWEKVKAISNGISVMNTLTSCASKLLPVGKLKTLLKAISNIFEGDGYISAFGILVDYVGCKEAFSQQKPNCPPNSGGGGGPSSPVSSFDPNGIYGYTAESGSKAVKDGQTEVYYTIEFENDPEFATASAHDIYLTNTLDATKFDLSTFKPTRINIGSKSAELSGDKNFVTTIDMRPEINVIAQVEGTYDEKTGTARWHISSLDPMTMEPTEEVMDGVLPVNYGGNGIGEVMYDIQLKPGLAHQTKVSNQASIVFDKNEAIQTPVWTNIIDRIAPTSHATEAKMLNDSTASVSIAATDELSGPWRYNVYVQYGDGAWFLGAENVPIDQNAKVKVYQGINHGFYTVVTDSAGNVEQKQAAREFTLDVFSPQIETTTKLQLAQGWNWISQNQNTALSAETLKPKAQRIVSQTEELYKDARLGWSGDLTELQPTEMYKVQMSSAASVQLSGLLYNASFRTVPLRKGWNWMGYPVAKTMTPAEALAKLEAEEDDALIGQDGMAQYSGGQWTGTLTTLQPGQGYMYRSASDKELFLNATAQASSRSNFAQSIVPNPPIPEDWTVDKRRYPNVMGIVANLYRNGQKEDANDWTVGAFAGEECRGIAQNVDGRLMMNVYGQGGEQIVFRAMYRESGEVVPISEQEAFRADLLGSVSEPYQLTIGTVTGIVDNERMRTGENEERAYDLQGRRVKSQASKGIYIVTDGKKSRTQKVVK